MPPLDRTTMNDDDDGNGPARAGIRLTLLWHADPARIGETVVLDASTRVVQLSRTSPTFPGGPPADPYQSRSPLELRFGPGGVVCWPASAELGFTVDGVAGTPGFAIPAPALVRGVRLVVGRRLVVLLERGDTPPVPREALGMVGVSVATDALRGALRRVAGRDDPVLLRGATGTGKDLAARAVHASSARARGPFVAVNVAAIPAETAASQLFGHVAGAFTGAARAHPGYFADAEGGTLFLDEIGELPDALQPLLLRALDAREVQPVGGRPRKVDVRVITATDADLDALVAERRFRIALLHRLAVHVVRLDPLRERPADLATQAALFAEREGVVLGARLLTAMLDHPWPGNTRQLRAFLARVAVDGEEAALRDLEGSVAVPAAPPAPGSPVPPRDIEAILAANDFAVDVTASALGISKNTLYAQMAAAGIPRGQDLDRGRIEAALAAAKGDVTVAAAALRVSGRALRLRMRALGLDG